jgi:hypothetical protein
VALGLAVRGPFPEAEKHMSLKEVWKPAQTLGSAFRPAVIAAVLGVALLGGCSLFDKSSDEDKDAQYVERPVEQIYNDAWKQIEGNNWLAAAKQFD